MCIDDYYYILICIHEIKYTYGLEKDGGEQAFVITCVQVGRVFWVHLVLMVLVVL